MGRTKAQKVAEDEEHLNALGHKQEMTRDFSFLSLLGLAFAILNSWTALSVSLSLSLPSGGPSSTIWGLITAGFANICLSASLGEFLSAFPTAAGQFYWVAYVSPPGPRRILSYWTGWITVGGWVAMNATGPLLGSQLVTGLIALMHDDYESKRWHVFVIYLAFSTGGFLINVFANRILPIVNKAAFYWSMTGFVVISITILACASPNFATGEYVYSDFENLTGWPNGFAWLLGLLQGAFGLAAYDSVCHMIEEIPDAPKQGPRVMVGAVLIGICTGWIFLSCVLFASGGEDNLMSIINARTGALIQVFDIATKSRAGSVCLTMFPLICMAFTTTSLFTASSRMTYAFARDNGLPWSRELAMILPNLKSPLYALCVSWAGVFVFGLVYLGSESAFNAITAAAVVWLNLSYALPVAINLFYGRKLLPNRRFKLPGPLGWTFNIIGVCYVSFTSILFLFPPVDHPDASQMNYCVVAFAILMVLCFGWWVVSAHKTFKGPPIEVAHRTFKGPHIELDQNLFQNGAPSTEVKPLHDVTEA